MSAKEVSVSVDRESRSIKFGLMRGQEIINLVSRNPGVRVLLSISDNINVPILSDDLLFIRGGEAFTIEASQPDTSDNSQAFEPAPLVLNDKPYPQNQPLHHGKTTGAELIALTGRSDVDVWFELDGIADELIEDSDRIIVQALDRFYTVPREDGDRFYEVTVILDGEDQFRRFPAFMTVSQAIRRSLPPHDRPQVNEFELVDGNVGLDPLNPNLTLRDAGVRDGHVLSITKKNGGGGSR